VSLGPAPVRLNQLRRNTRRYLRAYASGARPNTVCMCPLRCAKNGCCRHTSQNVSPSAVTVVLEMHQRPAAAAVVAAAQERSADSRASG
jgi:hypothetical protein